MLFGYIVFFCVFLVLKSPYLDYGRHFSSITFQGASFGGNIFGLSNVFRRSIFGVRKQHLLQNRIHVNSGDGIFRGRSPNACLAWFGHNMYLKNIKIYIKMYFFLNMSSSGIWSPNTINFCFQIFKIFKKIHLIGHISTFIFRFSLIIYCRNWYDWYCWFWHVEFCHFETISRRKGQFWPLANGATFGVVNTRCVHKRANRLKCYQTKSIDSKNSIS